MMVCVRWTRKELAEVSGPKSPVFKFSKRNDEKKGVYKYKLYSRL